MKIFHNIKEYYNNSGLRKKLFLILVLISIIPTVLIQIINYAFNTDILRNQVDSIRQAGLQQSHNEINMRLKTYNNLLSDFSNNEVVLTAMGKINVWDTQYQLAQRELRIELQKAIFSQPGILGMMVIAQNGQTTYYDTVTLSVIDSYCFDLARVTQQVMFQEAKKHTEEIFVETEQLSSVVHGDKNVLYLSKSLSDYRNLGHRPIATVVLCVDENEFSHAYRQALPKELDLTFMVDEGGQIVSSNDERLFGKNIFQAKGESLSSAVKDFIEDKKLSEGREVAVKTHETEDSNYIIVNVQQENYLLSQIYYRGSWILLIAVLMVIFTVAVIDYTSNNIEMAVRRIIRSMHQANMGDLDVRIDNDGKDEFAQISQNFNEMISRMKMLIHNEKRALERKRKAEIKALEAQINPHFLYNTLDSINWIAIEKEQFEISKMLRYLAIILRYSISNSNATALLSEELGYLKKYIYVQQNRFRYSFLCLIDAPDEVYSCRIHKLLMQPLIENSIEHAFPGPMEQDCIKIKIRLHEEEYKLKITVSDNGVGMNDTLIDELNHFDCEAENIKSNIGIRNVITRIKIYYGDDGGFEISKNVEHGTQIELTIPYEE